ncbi:MAG TPA: hypothetical protein PKA20_15955 [Burkholderiaceae bacterium]|nr:hypothetical protein [Burkholderiaceae bacterium]
MNKASVTKDGKHDKDVDPTVDPEFAEGGSRRTDEDFERNVAARRGGTSADSPKPSDDGHMGGPQDR